MPVVVQTTGSESTKKCMLAILLEGDIGVCGVAVLLSFLYGIPVNKIPHCGVAVISNPTLCDETKLVAVLRHQQYQYSLHADHELSGLTVYMIYT